MKQLVLTIIALVSLISTAYAAPSYKAARTEARKILRAENKFARIVSRLSEADRARLKAALQAYPDADADGASDLFEGARGSDVCNSDSDDDGVPDGEDDHESDSDGDDDGHSDDQEVETKGRITSFENPVLVIGDTTFTVTDSTKFEGVSVSSLVPGVCVEVEGHKVGDDTIADKIEKESRCRS